VMMNSPTLFNMTFPPGFQDCDWGQA